ncbi:MAG: 50S ribosomal protein L30 [Acidobacteriota bacterium]
MAATKMLRVTLLKSPIGCQEKQKKVVESLGLRRIRQTVEHRDTPEIRGMVFKVRHLVQVGE